MSQQSGWPPGADNQVGEGSTPVVVEAGNQVEWVVETVTGLPDVTLHPGRPNVVTSMSEGGDTGQIGLIRGNQRSWPLGICSLSLAFSNTRGLQWWTPYWRTGRQSREVLCGWISEKILKIF